MDTVQEENKKLRAALRDCADDLAAELEARYHRTLDYPSQKRKYDRDMAPVLTARALLGVAHSAETQSSEVADGRGP